MANSNKLGGIGLLTGGLLALGGYLIGKSRGRKEQESETNKDLLEKYRREEKKRRQEEKRNLSHQDEE